MFFYDILSVNIDSEVILKQKDIDTKSQPPLFIDEDLRTGEAPELSQSHGNTKSEPSSLKLCSRILWHFWGMVHLHSYSNLYFKWIQLYLFLRYFCFLCGTQSPSFAESSILAVLWKLKGHFIHAC